MIDTVNDHLAVAYGALHSAGHHLRRAAEGAQKDRVGSSGQVAHDLAVLARSVDLEVDALVAISQRLPTGEPGDAA